MSEGEAFAIMKAAFAETKVELGKNNKEQPVILPVIVIYTWYSHPPEPIHSSLMPGGLANDIFVEFVSYATLHVN